MSTLCSFAHRRQLLPTAAGPKDAVDQLRQELRPLHDEDCTVTHAGELFLYALRHVCRSVQHLKEPHIKALDQGLRSGVC
jgi:hypothetical protein